MFNSRSKIPASSPFCDIDFNGNTPLHHAAINNDFEKALSLVSDRANINANVNALNAQAWSPIVYAIRNDNRALANLLVEQGANFFKSMLNAVASMVYAIINGNAPLAMTIIAGAQDYVNITNKTESFLPFSNPENNIETSILMYAALQGDLTIFKALLAVGAIKEHKNELDLDAFAFALLNQRTAIIEYMSSGAEQQEAVAEDLFKPLDLAPLILQRGSQAVGESIRALSKETGSALSIWALSQAINGWYADAEKKIIWLGKNDFIPFLDSIQQYAKMGTPKKYYLALSHTDLADTQKHHAACYVEVGQDKKIRVLILDAAQLYLHSLSRIKDEAIELYHVRSPNCIQKDLITCQIYTLHHLINLLSLDCPFSQMGIDVNAKLMVGSVNEYEVDWSTLPLDFLINVQSDEQWREYTAAHKNKTPDTEIDRYNSLRQSNVSLPEDNKLLSWLTGKKESEELAKITKFRAKNNPITAGALALQALQNDYLKLLAALCNKDWAVAFRYAARAWQFSLALELLDKYSYLVYQTDEENNNVLHELACPSTPLVSEAHDYKLAYAEDQQDKRLSDFKIFEFITKVLQDKPEYATAENEAGETWQASLLANDKLAPDFLAAYQRYIAPPAADKITLDDPLPKQAVSVYKSPVPMFPHRDISEQDWNNPFLNQNKDDLNPCKIGCSIM